MEKTDLNLSLLRLSAACLLLLALRRSCRERQARGGAQGDLCRARAKNCVRSCKRRACAQYEHGRKCACERESSNFRWSKAKQGLFIVFSWYTAHARCPCACTRQYEGGVQCERQWSCCTQCGAMSLTATLRQRTLAFLFTLPLSGQLSGCNGGARIASPTTAPAAGAIGVGSAHGLEEFADTARCK